MASGKQIVKENVAKFEAWLKTMRRADYAILFKSMRCCYEKEKTYLLKCSASAENTFFTIVYGSSTEGANFLTI
tara:strand:+ start:1104 stop:1325 length:222 start_codon:yes stop_codon:yes gene_type:complete